MNSLILSALTMTIVIFHRVIRGAMRKGHVGTGFATMWCVDAVFAVCGTVLSYALYHYPLRPWMTLRNLMLTVVYLALTILFVVAAPSGISLLRRREKRSEEEIFRAEYRLNETLCMVRGFLMALLFFLPILFAVIQHAGREVAMLTAWKEGDICGGFCFVAFLILLPVSVRQMIYWIRNLDKATTEAENGLLGQYRARLLYRHKNRML